MQRFQSVFPRAVFQMRTTQVVSMRAFSSTDKKGYVDHRNELPYTEFPTVAKKGSFKLDLVKGESYFYCTCGKSANQPLCDGKHRGTEYKPLKFTWDQEDKRKSICGCKLNLDHSGPLCDRSHRRLRELEGDGFEMLGEELKPGFTRDADWVAGEVKRDD